jgi:hypothetical protein
MSANMKPPAAATDAFMQDLARKGNADDVPDRKFEGVHIQKNGDQVPPPSALKKKKPGHKPMSAALYSMLLTMVVLTMYQAAMMKTFSCRRMMTKCRRYRSRRRR